MQKHFLLITLLLLLSVSIFAQSTAIPDSHFEQALITLGLDTGNPDGVVPTSNIDTVTNLSFLGLNFSGMISSLAGIEDFVALEHLYCATNLLDSLDLSSNTALKTLDCTDNLLTFLNVSQNVNLEHLTCSRNRLDSLDLSNCTALTRLACGNNLLTALDISQNTALTILRVPSNQLASLDVSQQTALDFLNCSANPLGSLDVSQNVNLLELYCPDTQLSTLDVSQNPNLSLLSASSNQLTVLDVSQNLALQRLTCVDNQLTSLDLQYNPLLRILYCQNNALSCLNVRNGNNSQVGSYFDATGNPNLSCIDVDNVAWATANWSGSVDATASFSTNCGNAACAVGVRDRQAGLDDLEIYPNPTRGRIAGNLQAVREAMRVTVRNGLGQLVLQQDFDAVDQFELDIAGPAGLYFLQLETAGGESRTVKVVKE